MTKEQIDTLVKSLDRLGLGTNNGDGVHERNNGLLVSVISVPLYPIPYLPLFSTLERINDKLRDIFNLIKNAGYIGSNNGKVVSELMDEIRAVITNCQVSSKAQTGSEI